MMSVAIAIVLMVVATTAVHLGLPQEIAKVIMKICGCHKCSSFWLTLVILSLYSPLWLALLLSFTAAYLSNWFALLLILLNKLYDRLWGKLRK